MIPAWFAGLLLARCLHLGSRTWALHAPRRTRSLRLLRLRHLRAGAHCPRRSMCSSPLLLTHCRCHASVHAPVAKAGAEVRARRLLRRP